MIGCDATIARGLRRRTARAERDDAGHRLERAARLDDPARSDAGVLRRAASTGIARGRRRAAASCSTAAPRSRPRSARTSATPRRRTSPRTSVETGRSIRDLVRERRLLDRRAARRDPVGRGDDDRRACPGRRASGTSGTSLRGAMIRQRAGRRSLLALQACAAAPQPAARPAVRSAGSGPARRAGSRRSGSAPIRSWTRSASPTAASSLTSARAADGSRSGSRGASGRTASSSPKTSSTQMIESINRRVEREGLQNARHDDARHRRAIPACRPGRSTPCSSSTRITRWSRPGRAAAQPRASLKPRDGIGIVDFTAEGGGPGPAAGRARRSRARDQATRKRRGCGYSREQVPAVSVHLVFETGRQRSPDHAVHAAGQTCAAARAADLDQVGEDERIEPRASAVRGRATAARTRPATGRRTANTTARPHAIASTDVR